MGCPVRDKCYRYTAFDSGKRQYWMETPGYYIEKEGKELFTCNMYWGNSTDAMYNQLKDIVNGRL